MRKQTHRLLIGLVLLAAIPALLLGHPHFMRKGSVMVGQDQAISLEHVTVPFNEARPSAMDVGSDWSIYGGKLSTPVNLKSGDTQIPAGDYQIKIHKDSEKSYSMALSKGGENYKLVSKFADGLSDQDHLVIDLHMRGAGDAMAGYIDLRFGTFMVSGKIQIDQAASE